MYRNLIWTGNVLGSSRPWRVLALDSPDAGGLPRELIVKHFRADQRMGRVVEYVAARFAFETDIHAIQPELVYFTAAFLSELRTLPEPPRDIHLAEPGVQVAFAWNSRAICLLENHSALYSLEDPDQVGEIIGVDTVLVNLDRSDQNVLFEPRADHRGRPIHLLYPIDWELCFAGQLLDTQSLRNPDLLEMQRPWTGGRADPMCARIRSADDFLGAIGKLGGWTGARARLKLMLQGIPREWEVAEEMQAALLEYFIGRIKATITRLRRSDDPEHAFPNWQGSFPLDSSA